MGFEYWPADLQIDINAGKNLVGKTLRVRGVGLASVPQRFIHSPTPLGLLLLPFAASRNGQSSVDKEKAGRGGGDRTHNPHH